MALTQGLYRTYRLKRVFYSAYMPVSNSPLLPAPQGFQPPLLREHRLYQADWLLRFYHFQAEEILDENQPYLDPRLDPKCGWALRHLEHFPVEVNRADYETLLRVPGIGVKSARRILAARRFGPLNFQGLKQLGVVLKRPSISLPGSGRMERGLRVSQDGLLRHLVALEAPNLAQPEWEQLSLFSMGRCVMNWTQVSYLYDGSLAGFLTCVFEAYTHREEPADFTPFDQACASFYAQRSVETDRAKAQRVYRSLEAKLGKTGKDWLLRGFLTCLPTGNFGFGASSAWDTSEGPALPGTSPTRW